MTTNLGDGETNVSNEQLRPIPRILVLHPPTDGRHTEGDKRASEYRYEAPWKFWCKPEWIIDTQLKKLCDDALEKEEIRQSFKYNDYWWTVKHDQEKGTRVFRNTDYTMKMLLDEYNKLYHPLVTSLDELPDWYWREDSESKADTEIVLVRTNDWWEQWDRFAINRLLSQGCRIHTIVQCSEGWFITLRYDSESEADTEIALVRTKYWWSDHVLINRLLARGYEIDRIVPGSEGCLITLTHCFLAGAKKHTQDS